MGFSRIPKSYCVCMMFSTRENTSRWMNRYKNYSQEKHSPKAKREIVACFVKVRQKQKVGRNNSSGNVLVVRTIRRITKLSKLINSNEFLHLLWNCVIHFHFFSLSLFLFIYCDKKVLSGHLSTNDSHGQI